MIPILANAAGGVLAGLVAKYAGSVARATAIVAGIVLTGFLEGLFVSASGLTWRLWLALVLVVFCTLVYTSFPYVEKAPEKKKND